MSVGAKGECAAPYDQRSVWTYQSKLSSSVFHLPDTCITRTSSLITQMESLPKLPTTRRLVTGHNKTGKAIFEFDEILMPVNPFPQASPDSGTSLPALGVTLIHRTRGFPVKIQGSIEELTPDNVRRGQGMKGIVCQIVDLAPTPKGQDVLLHRNQSLDYGVVLKGSMQIILDDGAEETLREGDVYVQK